MNTPFIRNKGSPGRDVSDSLPERNHSQALSTGCCISLLLFLFRVC